MKREISVELKEQCIELYQEVLDKEQTDAIAVKKIKDLFTVKNETVSERTIYRWLESWKKDLSIKSVIESYDVDLNRPKFISDDIMERLYKRFQKADDNDKTDQRTLIQWADCLSKYIDISVKIDVLRSKKKTTSTDADESSKIITLGAQ